MPPTLTKVARENDKHPARGRALDPGFVIDGEWLCHQLERRDPLWADWHHNASPLARAACEIFDWIDGP